MDGADAMDARIPNPLLLREKMLKKTKNQDLSPPIVKHKLLRPVRPDSSNRLLALKNIRNLAK